MITKHKFFILLIGAVAVGQLPLFSIEAQSRPQSVMMKVPYASQIPTGDRNDPRQADGCEEASIIMAMAWARGGSHLPADEVERDIINISEYERVIYGFYQDTSAQDTARVMREFYQYKDVTTKEGISVEDIKQELAQNRLVIFPLNTRLTGLPIYRTGPPRHTVVAVGYDDKSDSLIINDPLYGNARNMWVPSSNIQSALSNYYSGIHRPGNTGTALISVGKQDKMYE